MDLAVWWKNLQEAERRVVWINCLLQSRAVFGSSAYEKEKFYQTTAQLQANFLQNAAFDLEKSPSLEQLEAQKNLHCVFVYDDKASIQTARLTLPMRNLEDISWQYAGSVELDFGHLGQLRTLSCSSLNALRELRLDDCRKLSFCSLTHCNIREFDSRPFSQLSTLILRGNPLKIWHFDWQKNAALYQLDLAATRLQSLNLRQLKIKYLEVAYMRCLREFHIDEAAYKQLNERSKLQVGDLRAKIERYAGLQDWWEGLYSAQRALLLANAHLSLNGGVHALSASNHSLQKEYSRQTGLALIDEAAIWAELGSFMPLLYCTHLNLNSESVEHQRALLSFDFLQPLKGHLQTLDLSGCGQADLNLSDWAELKAVSGHNCPNLRLLSISRCPKLEKLNFSNSMPYPEQRMDWLRISHCAALQEINLNGQALKRLEISECPQLERLQISSNDIRELLSSSIPHTLTELDISFNRFQYLLPFLCPKLEKLNCAYNRLEELTPSAYPLLKTLKCNNNQLKSLNCTQLHQIEEIDCSHNLLETLHLAPQASESLHTLCCQANQLKDLQLDGFSALRRLSAPFNPRLRTVSIEGCISLADLELNNTNRVLQHLQGLESSALPAATKSQLQQMADSNLRYAKSFSAEQQHRGFLLGLSFAEMSALRYMLGLQEGRFSKPRSATQTLQIKSANLPEISQKTSSPPATIPLASLDEAYFYPLLMEEDALARLSALQKLSARLAERELSSLKRVLPFFSSLRRLFVARQPSIKDLEGLSHCPQLEEVSVSLSGIYSLAGIEECLLLRRLTIDDCPLSDLRPLAHLPKLEVLDISATQVQSLLPLHSIGSLRTLICADCPRLTSIEVERLRLSLPQCQVIAFL